jgi:RNase H-fold protein (predicted Holliday junction resolvase)
VRFDERFTSKMAFQTLIDAGVNKKTRANKALRDKISATIILQSYLQHIEARKHERTNARKEVKCSSLIINH